MVRRANWRGRQGTRPSLCSAASYHKPLPSAKTWARNLLDLSLWAPKLGLFGSS